jgi:CheY-like chemotaxis protein
VPLRLSDKVIGVLNVESKDAGAFTEDDRQFAEMFATYIALALHILNLLVAERSTTGQAVTGTVEGEIAEPLTDITQVVAKLKESGLDPRTSSQIERIVEDVEAIRKRLRNVGQGAATVLGADDAVAKAARGTDPILRGRRILVADDDQRIRQLVAEVLRARGAEVLVCEDGTSAVAAIEQLAAGGVTSTGPAVPGQERSVGAGAPARAKRLDLLISDIRLPDKTGYEIFSAARGVLPELPVILMTGFGYDPHHSIVRASQSGLSAVLFKPFQAERLIEECHKALGA